MAVVSDKDRLLDELDAIEVFLVKNVLWTVEVSEKYIRREEIKRLLKTLGKKDWL